MTGNTCVVPPVCVNDYEELFKKNTPEQVWNYFCCGANHEQTLKDNCLAFTRYKLRPMVLKDVSDPDLSSSVLGRTISFPVCVAATAMNGLAHPDRDVAVAKSAASLNIGYTLSSWSTSSIEEIADVTRNSSKWFQLNDRQVTRSLVKRAASNGYEAIFLTIDMPVIGVRYRDGVSNFSLPSHLRLANLYDMKNSIRSSGQSGDLCSLLDPSLQWSDVEWLKSITDLPVVLKGILTVEMAEIAVQHGVDGIVVSNHGARQLDGVPATIDALPEVVRAVAGRCEVYMDGGVRCGTDVLKAVALGARAVFVGRPVIWGLAYDGEQGVTQVLNILKEEFKISMQLMGCRSIDELQNNRNLVVRDSLYKSRL